MEEVLEMITPFMEFFDIGNIITTLIFLMVAKDLRRSVDNNTDAFKELSRVVNNINGQLFHLETEVKVLKAIVEERTDKGE